MMKNDIPCSVIRDLLPLYNDALCSPESAELVEQHLQICPECRALTAQLPLPDQTEAVLPDEAKVFRKLHKKIRRGKLLKAGSIAASVLLLAFLVLNAVWLPVKYFPYKAFCRQFSNASDIGKGTQYQTISGDYAFRVKMPGYLSFESGFLAVEPAERALQNADPALIRGTDAREPDAASQQEPQQTKTEAALFIWPQPFGETEYGVMIFEQESPTMTHATQFIIRKDLTLSEQKNHLPDETPEQAQHNKELYEANLDAVRGLMDAAMQQWGDLLS